jgi:flagellar biosynthesis protein FlhF
MQAALQKVKAEMGADAVILHTRSIKRGGVLGLYAREVVEITASDETTVLPRPRPAAPEPERAYRKAAVLSSAREVLSKARGVCAVQDAPSRNKETGVLVGIANAPPQKRADSAAEYAQSALSAEIKEIKDMVREVARAASKDIVAGYPPALQEAYKRLAACDISEDTALEIVSAVRESLGSAADYRRTMVHVESEITSRIRIAGPIDPASGTRAAVFIGPTGVGKTTTIAKLAADFALNRRVKVALITVDTYRIAAVEQLRTYARIIGVPFSVVNSAGELTAAVAAHRDRDLILVDTAGRSQRDALKMEELEAVLGCGAKTERYLVIDSTSQRRKQFEVIDRFRSVEPRAVILTKLDEAACLGSVLDVAAYSKLPIAYVTTGQEVPDDIEIAKAQVLARLILEREANRE